MESGMHSKIETRPIRVIITTDTHEIEGFMHIKPGGYQSRVSDLLNMHDLQYIPITQAIIQNLAQVHKAPWQVDTLILRLDTIKMVTPLSENTPRHAEPGPDQPPPGQQPDDEAGSPWGGSSAPHPSNGAPDARDWSK